LEQKSALTAMFIANGCKREVQLLRQLVEKTSGNHGSELVGGAVSDNDDRVRSIRTIAPHELEC
jgi:hypothetical protein